jgi:Tfp pilus assembly protein PilN
MTSCLGLYIEDNIMKYAKVSKEREKIKIESFGVKFYDNLEETLEQVIQETYSFKTPICVNLAEENYMYFDMFAMLKPKDLAKAIKTEFDGYCAENGYNPNVFETKYAVTSDPTNKEKLRIIHISNNKIELNKRTQPLERYKLIMATPLAMNIANLIETKPKENCLIVNIEEKTSITTVLDQKIYGVTTIDDGSSTFLGKINLKENSYSKAYEICKNTTIYTSEGKELQDEEMSYLEDIMPTLYEIVNNVKKIIDGSLEKITKVYITGTASVINNIDLYFQEYLGGVECEILKPYFIKPTREINIREYIETNSAIALALSGLGEGIGGLNFKKQTLEEKIPDWLKVDITPGENKDKRKTGGWFTNDLKQALDKTEIMLLRTVAGIAILFIVYCSFSILLNKQLNKKEEEVEDSIANTNKQIALVKQDNNQIKTKTNEYTTMIQNLQDINDRITDANQSRNAIPNLLNTLMHTMPENVQITSIQNTTGTHVEIYAQSDKYEQLGFFVGVIKTNSILTDVISTAGEKENSVVVIKIEGELP